MPNLPKRYLMKCLHNQISNLEYRLSSEFMSFYLAFCTSALLPLLRLHHLLVLLPALALSRHRLRLVLLLPAVALSRPRLRLGLARTR
jgi:hypothetical protein